MSVLPSCGEEVEIELSVIDNTGRIADRYVISHGDAIDVEAPADGEGTFAVEARWRIVGSTEAFATEGHDVRWSHKDESGVRVIDSEGPILNFGSVPELTQYTCELFKCGSASCADEDQTGVATVTVNVHPAGTAPKPELQLAVQGQGEIHIANQPVCSPGEACAPVTIGASDIVLTAVPRAGHEFAEWQGDCDQGQTPVYTITASSPSMSCTAVFRPATGVSVPTLEVTVEGAGTVTINPGSITCQENSPCHEEFSVGTSVELTAVPTDSAYFFAGWTGTCVGEGPTTTIILSENVLVRCTAIFEEAICDVAPAVPTIEITQLPSFTEGADLVAPANYMFLSRVQHILLRVAETPRRVNVVWTVIRDGQTSEPIPGPLLEFQSGSDAMQNMAPGPNQQPGLSRAEPVTVEATVSFPGCLETATSSETICIDC